MATLVSIDISDLMTLFGDAPESEEVPYGTSTVAHTLLGFVTSDPELYDEFQNWAERNVPTFSDPLFALVGGTFPPLHESEAFLLDLEDFCPHLRDL